MKKRRMKHAEIVLRWGERKIDGGGDPTKIYSKHMCKYHNVFPSATVI
jgi:hypothetical protein